MIDVYLITLSAVVLGQITPGPNFLAVASVSLANGRRAGVFVSIGIAAGVFFWVLSAALGLSAVVLAYPAVLFTLKILGGSYLIYIGFRSLKGAVQQGHVQTVFKQELKGRSAIFRGFLINVSNPKSGLMWLAIISFMLGSGLTPTQVLLASPVGALTALAIYSTYAVLFSTQHAISIYQHVGRWLDGAFGTMFGLLGGKLLLDGLRELRSQ